MSIFNKKLIVLICMCIYSAIVLGIDLEVMKVEESTFTLRIVPNKDEAICRDYIKFSIDLKGFDVEKWESVSDAVEEYVAPLKLRGKVYRGAFVTKLFLNKPHHGVCMDCLFSCLVLKNDDTILPFFKKIELISDKKITKSVQLNRKKVVTSTSYAKGWKVDDLIVYHKEMHDSSKALLVGLLLMFIIGFLVINVIAFSDMVGFLVLGIWVCFGRLIFSYPILLSGCAFILLATSIFLFRKKADEPTFPKIIRNLIGFVTAAAVLPIITEVFLTLRVFS
jgi:hypothetical protein